MIATSYSFFGAVAFMPAGPAPAAQGTGAARERSEAGAVPAPTPSSDKQEEREAALQERYFEEMISSAADLLLRTQNGAPGSRFGL